MNVPPDRPALFFLHALGGSGRAFDGAAALLPDFHVVAIDLPGFGDASPALGCDVEATAQYVTRRIVESGATRWLLVGHSMGGKIASIVAARALAGEPGLFGLRGVVLLAGSPPSPEPMDETRREKMLGWARTGPLDEAAANAFLDANVGGELAPASRAAALDDLRRTTREAWLAWLERGSREDWSPRVGTLDLPALILAGGADGDLGPAGQRETNVRVYPRAALRVLEGAGHLLPLERPREVATAIADFWREDAGRGPIVPPHHARLIASERVSRRTRGILARRSLADAPTYAPRALDAASYATLSAIAARVVPQEAPAIDLVARLDAQLAQGKGDGWRFAEMPGDVAAHARAAAALADFAACDTRAQDETLARIAEGAYADGGAFTATRMRRWFEDLRADLVRLWLSHPATMAAIGFDGFANGGDGERKQGFTRLAAGEREAWQFPATTEGRSS